MTVPSETPLQLPLDPVQNHYGYGLVWWLSRYTYIQTPHRWNSFRIVTATGALTYDRIFTDLQDACMIPYTPYTSSTPYTPYTPLFHTHTSTIPCMIAISAYMAGYSGVQRYTVVYSSVSSAFSALCTTSELCLLLSHLLLPITALPKDWCLPDIAVTISLRSEQ